MTSKQMIEEYINTGNLEEAKALIDEYEKKNPFDAELLTIKSAYYLSVGEEKQAYDYAKQAVEQLPLNGEIQFNYGVLCEIVGDYFESYRAYKRASFIFQYTNDEKNSVLEPDKHGDDVLAKITQIATRDDVTQEETLEILSGIKGIEAMEKTAFGLCEHAYSECNTELIGTWTYDDFHQGRYVGSFKDQYFNAYGNPPKYNDVVRIKGEFILADQATKLVVDSKEKEYIVPIACDEATPFLFRTNGSDYAALQYRPRSYEYYRVPGGTEILAKTKFIYGKPIPVKQDPNKKKLVMSIFVDGLSYSIIKGEKFKENMPHTYEYFKKGMIFDNAYNTGEWTYPSIASYVCSMDTTHHMLFHHSLDYPMPVKVPTIAESFHNDGFYTSKYCGNWRIIPGYGHARGYDRFVYQHQCAGFKVHEVIADAINQIDAAKELNQYMWISIGDLHDVADKFKLPFGVQKDIPIENRVYHEKGATSVKQKYNPDDRLAYIRMAKHIDKWLHILFNHIEENYNQEDVVVSLFSDHGQGYLIEREGAHFLSSERSNVPMMFRGGLAEGKGYCDETVSALDYANMLRKISGVPPIKEVTDGNLPEALGGEKRRQYAYTESIHPGDPYQAAIFANDMGVSFFFYSNEPVLDDGRFWLKEYNYWLEDMSGNVVHDKEKEEHFLKIVMNHIAPILMYE
jgi:tetratricopeptide (TPR) repeat protein